MKMKDGSMESRVIPSKPGKSRWNQRTKTNLQWKVKRKRAWGYKSQTLGDCHVAKFQQKLNNVKFVCTFIKLSISSVQSFSRVRLFATPWIAAPQASLSITNCRSSHRLTSIESVMPSSHLILCHPLLLLPPILPASKSFPMSQHFA